MGYILNEFSLDGQFEDTEYFIESLYENTLPVLKKLDEKQIRLLKSYNIYTSKVTENKSFQDILQDRSYSEIRDIKRLLVQLLLDDPYWDDESKCVQQSIYECEFTEEINNHCIAEALERNTSLLSFEHDNFKLNKIDITKDDEQKSINNIYDKESMLLELLNSNKIDYNEYLCEKYENIDTFCILNGKDYFKELIDTKDLSKDEVKSIIRDLEVLIDRHNKNLPLGRFHDTIEHYHEFRTSISDNRQIRIFYILENGKFVFLNCLLKKQQSTPESAKAKARSLVKEYKSCK